MNKHRLNGSTVRAFVDALQDILGKHPLSGRQSLMKKVDDPERLSSFTAWTTIVELAKELSAANCRAVTKILADFAFQNPSLPPFLAGRLAGKDWHHNGSLTQMGKVALQIDPNELIVQSSAPGQSLSTHTTPRHDWEWNCGADFSWRQLPDLLTLGGRRLAYLELLPRANPDALVIGTGGLAREQVKLERGRRNVNLNNNNQNNRQSLALESFSFTEPQILSLTLNRTLYDSFLSGVYEGSLDPAGHQTSASFQRHFQCLQLTNQNGQCELSSKLTNICGVGLFLYTSDQQIVASVQPAEGKVYPGRYTFAASGTTRPGAYPHPFTEVMRVAYEHFGHQANPDQLRLLALGRDARKGYVQFMFVERLNCPADQIQEEAQRWEREGGGTGTAKLEVIPFASLNDLREPWLQGSWEPAAEVGLLMLASALLGIRRSEVENWVREIDWESWKRKCIRDEWEARADRDPELADLSGRDAKEDQTEAADFVADSFVDFIKDKSAAETRKSSALDIGCGTGRIACRLANRGYNVVAVDISPRMVDHLVDRHRNSFPGQETAVRSNKVQRGLRLQHEGSETTIDVFSMDFEAYFMEAPVHRHFDLVVLSRICIHQVFPEDLAALVASACNATKKDVFVAEDVRERKSGPFTRIWTVEDYKRAFAAHSFSLKSSKSQALGADNIEFLHFSANQ